MARLSAVLATTHHPFYLKATQLTPPEQRMPQADEWRRKVEAYRETLRAVAEIEGIEAARCPKLRAQIVRRFTGPDYGWMWPFPRTVEQWIAEALDEIEREATAR